MAAAGPPGGAPAVIQAVIFARSPAERASIRVLDMAGIGDKKLYYKAVEKLSDNTFGLEPERLKAFLNNLRVRSSDAGWYHLGTGITDIPHDVNDPDPVLDNLIDNYGVITMECIRDFEESYINGVSRGAQDTAMMYSCIMASLTEAGKSQIELHRDEFMVGNLPSGNLLLRVIIRESHLDTHATTSVLRSQLNKLYLYMPMVNSDIVKFNTYVRTTVSALAARGATTEDLLVNLFVGYQVASDKNFRKYADDAQSHHEDGTYNIASAEALMIKMENWYKTLKMKGLWDAPSDEEQKIMALQAQIVKIPARTIRESTTSRMTTNVQVCRRHQGQRVWMYR
jgi:hypothetical protein